MPQRIVVCLVPFVVMASCLERRAAGVETVRVDASSGAPRLLVDGQPVRARMFFGIPGSAPIPVGPTARQVVFEFTPTTDEPHRATMHFRFGQTPGDVFLDDLRVVDLATGEEVIPRCGFDEAREFSDRWTFWPTGPENTVGAVRVEPKAGREGSGGLRVALKAPPQSRWPDFHVYHRPTLALRAGHRYRVEFWARSEPARDLIVAFYRPGQPFVFLGGPGGVFEAQIKLAAEVGVDFVSFPLGMPWPKPGETVDWTTVDASCEAVLQANPRALLLPRLGMDPPEWWLKAHPEDAMVWDVGPQHRGVVVASPAYRRDAAERLAALVEHVEAKFGPHVAGYHPCGQNTGEWFYHETWGPALNGYAEGDQRAWRRWLLERYPDDAALRTAWGDARVARQSAAVPSPAARRAAPAGTFRDPKSERALIDFAAFQQEAMADCVCQLAHAVRQATHGRKLVVFFYGYVFEFGAIGLGPATSGHYALRRVLDCPDLDVLCSPISYFDRGLGQSAPAMTAAESVALAGKMWLYEDDTATHLSTGTFPGWRERVTTIEETSALLVRNTAQCAVRHFATWWMDLGATGWFNDPRLWAEMKWLEALDRPLMQRPCPFRPEVAAIIDECSMLRVAAGGSAVTVPGVYEVRRPLGRMGAPYGQYLLDDVLAGRVRAKVYVFLNAWRLSPDQRKRLLAATSNHLRIWCYAPGYHEEDHTSLDAMRELTGFRLVKHSGNAWAEPTAVGRKLGLQTPLGLKRPVEPLFWASDATTAETLAAYPDGSPAIALRQTESGLSMFVGPPGLTSDLLRLAARRAAVRLVTQTDCNVYANGPYLVLHASQDGPLDIDTGQPGPVRDLRTGRVVGQGPTFSLPARRAETRVLEVQSPP
jgi:hypothetical protein